MPDDDNAHESEQPVSSELYSRLRQDQRRKLPEVYRKYIHVEARVGDAWLVVDLLDFSRRGLQIKSSVPIDVESIVPCSATISLSLSRSVDFSMLIKYCNFREHAYFIGGEITSVENEVWFSIFEEVHDFIVSRTGDVY